jgi:hypothetical protein
MVMTPLTNGEMQCLGYLQEVTSPDDPTLKEVVTSEFGLSNIKSLIEKGYAFEEVKGHFPTSYVGITTEGQKVKIQI